MLVKVHYLSSLKIPQQMNEKGYHEIYCWLFPSIFIQLSHKTRNIYMIESISTSRILSIKSIPCFKGRTFIRDTVISGTHCFTTSFNKAWTQDFPQCRWVLFYDNCLKEIIYLDYWRSDNENV